jgi:hypothetical protein
MLVRIDKVRRRGLKRLSQVQVVEKSSTTVIDSLEFAHDIGTSEQCAADPVRGARRNFLLHNICRPRRAPEPRWHFTYRTLATDDEMSQVQLFNELDSIELFVKEAGSSGETLSSARKYGREATSSFVNVVVTQELVTRQELPGMTLPIRISEAGAITKRLVEMEGSPPRLVTLSSFFSVKKTQIGERTYTTTYANDAESPTSTAKVVPTRIEREDGTVVDLSYEPGEGLRRTSLTATPGSQSADGGQLANGPMTSTTPSHDARFGIPLELHREAAGGLPSTTTVAVADTGDVVGMTTPTDEGAVGFSLAHDALGRPTTGTDADGNTVTWSAPHPRFGVMTKQ